MNKEYLIKYFKQKEGWKIDDYNDDNYILYFYKPLEYSDHQISVEAFLDIDENFINNIVFSHSEFYDDENLSLSQENVYLLDRILSILETDQVTLKKHILKSYLKASERFEQIYYPVLKELTFTPWLDEVAGAKDYESDSVFTYRFSYKLNIKSLISKNLWIGAQDFQYNYIEDTIYWENEDLFILTKEEFYEKLVKNLKNDSSTSFLFSTDPKHTANSRYYVLSLLDCIDDYKRNKKPMLEEIIDFNQIPDSYQHVIEEYNYYKILYEENNAAIEEKRK